MKSKIKLSIYLPPILFQILADKVRELRYPSISFLVTRLIEEAMRNRGWIK